MQAVRVRPGTARVTYPKRASRTCVVKPQALFGWGKGSEDAEPPRDRKAEREEQFRLQQEMLEARKSGSAIREANVRRQKVQEELAARRALRREEKEALGRGEMPESLKNWKPYDKLTESKATSGIVVPLLPFGIGKYDEGERFDLRSPYADDGWVDPEETDMWGSFKNIGQKLLNFGNVKPAEAGKPILWASQYGKPPKNQPPPPAKGAKQQPKGKGK